MKRLKKQKQKRRLRSPSPTEEIPPDASGDNFEEDYDDDFVLRNTFKLEKNLNCG